MKNAKWNPAASAMAILNAPVREMYGSARTR